MSDEDAQLRVTDEDRTALLNALLGCKAHADYLLRIASPVDFLRFRAEIERAAHTLEAAWATVSAAKAARQADRDH